MALASAALSQPQVQSDLAKASNALTSGIDSLIDSVASGISQIHHNLVYGSNTGDAMKYFKSEYDFKGSDYLLHDADTIADSWAKSWQRTSVTAKDDAEAIEKTITFPWIPDSPDTYYHTTTLENALNIQATNIMTGSKWEGGYIYAWRRMPSKKVLNLSGAASTEVLVSFQTYSAFAPDPAFSGNNTDLSLLERLKINAYMPVRSCVSGAIYVSNVQIIK